MLGSRCRERGTNPLCPVDIEDPQPSITAVDVVSHQLVLCTITAVMNSTKVQNPWHKMQVALLAEPKTLEYYEQ